MRSKLLTREMLENHGVTNVTRDGKIFIGDREMKQTIAVKKGKYKVQQPYARVSFSDKSRRIPQVNKKGYHYWTYPTIAVLVSRAVYAWYHGEVPAGYEIDHIDTNTLNNSISNLRVLTKEENLARKPLSRNQYTCNKTDEEILAERANRRYLYDRSQHKIVKTDWWAEMQTEKKIQRAVNSAGDKAIKALWHDLNKKIREKQAERRLVDKVNNIDEWRKLGNELDVLKIALIETRKKLHQ